MLLICACWLLCPPPLAIADQYADEAPLFKAAYIYNFAKLVSWPEGTWRSSAMPFNLCILGEDSVSQALKKLVGKKIKGHDLSVQSYRVQLPKGHCQLLYIANNMKLKQGWVASSLSERAVLSVSEIPGFLNQGGVIELFRQDQRTRFKISQGNANQRGLEISSRLLTLAALVEDRPTP
jgi:hypothetical protein